MKVKYSYAIKVIRKMGSMGDGRMWQDMLPDELFLSRYNFDGWEVKIDNDFKAQKDTFADNQRIETYELFWYPETFEDARELFSVMHDMKEHTLFEGCDFKFTVLTDYPETVEVGVI